MKPISLRIKNFGSIQNELTFHFPQESGLFFMQGVNEVEPRLGSNGAGKTTIWKALTWLLYAKTGNGLKAGDVCNWETNKGVEVELDFRYENDERCLWTMTRTWKPNAWRLSHIAEYVTDEEAIDLTKDESNPVLADLRLDFVPFLNCVLMAQGEPMFLDLKHDAKAALFSDVLGLDLWLDYSAKASKRASAQDVVTRGLERELSALIATRNQIQGQDLTSHIDDWQAQQDAELNALEQRYEQLVVRLKEDQAAVKKAEDERDRKRAYYQECRTAVTAMRKKVETASAKYDELRLLTAQTRGVVRAAQELNSQSVCPTCGQDLYEGHRHSTKHLKKQEDDLADLEGYLQEAKEIMEDLDGELRKKQEDERDADQDWRDAERAIQNAKRDCLTTEKELDAIEDKVEELGKAKNPYADLHDLQQREGLRVANQIASTQRLLDDSMSQYSLFSFWVRGFKEVRLQLIAEALNELEVEVNSCVAQLGLVDWELNFMVDRETKSGNVQKGFNVFVRSPRNDAAVPWEAWSGGEAQRLRVAANMGLANLIRTRTGAGFNLEVWDEPSQGLSQQGVTDLLEALAARAQAEERVIWIVDHTAHSFGGFAGGAVITKTSKGSQLTQLDASGIYLK